MEQLTSAYISLQQLTTAVTAGGFSLYVPVNIVVKTDPGKSEWNSLHQLTSDISLHQLTTVVTAGGFSLFVLVNIVVKTDPGKIEWNSLHQLTSANIS